VGFLGAAFADLLSALPAADFLALEGFFFAEAEGRRAMQLSLAEQGLFSPVLAVPSIRFCSNAATFVTLSAVIASEGGRSIYRHGCPAFAGHDSGESRRHGAAKPQR
jgi:hypothetical protein